MVKSVSSSEIQKNFQASLMEVGVDDIVQMDPPFDNLCSYEAHYNTYTQ